MAYFTTEDKAFFKANGYVVGHDTLREEQVRRAVDVLWEHIEADRDDPETWVNAGPRGNLPCTNHPDILATLHDTPLVDMAEELVGKGKLKVSNNPFCKMVYPTGNESWSHPDHGHMDGYTMEGVVHTFTVGVTVNINPIKPQGGGFTIWPGTHIRAAEYFKTHSLLTPSKAYGERDLPEPVEITGPPGTVCFWHHLMMHSAGINCRKEIRMAFVSRLVRVDIEDVMFETPDDMWEYWEGIA